MTQPVTLITGANRGIGLAMTREAMARGHRVIGTHRGAVPDMPGPRWEALEVTDPASAKDLGARLAATPLSLLVCNAGVFTEDPSNPDHWKDAFAINVMGVSLSIEALLPALKAAPDARIAIIASYMGSSARAPGGSLIYRASKAAAINLGRNLATDLRADGIAVGIYHPGWVQTEMGGPGAEITPEAAAHGLMDRFAALTLARTGIWEDWQGQALPY